MEEMVKIHKDKELLPEKLQSIEKKKKKNPYFYYFIIS